MDRAKALVGEYAGQLISAEKPGLTYSICIGIKPYCPVCRQPVHIRKSDIIRSYFAHYDFIDKNCPNRVIATGNSTGSYSNAESRGQDLDEIEAFLQDLFYGMSPAFFETIRQPKPYRETYGTRPNQKKRIKKKKGFFGGFQELFTRITEALFGYDEPEDDGFEGSSEQYTEPEKSLSSREDTSLITTSADWLRENINTQVRRWVAAYCKNVGFMGWPSQRSIGYLTDILHMLEIRESILMDLSEYAISTCHQSSQLDIKRLQRSYGVNISVTPLIPLVVLDLVIQRILLVLEKTEKFNLEKDTRYMECKLPPNRSSCLSFRSDRRKTPGAYRLLIRVSGSIESPVNSSTRFIVFRKAAGLENHFWYNADGQSIGKNRALELHIDSDGDLTIRGRVHHACSNTEVVEGITKVLFNKTDYSMLLLVREGFISTEIAEKAAQLALKHKHGNLNGNQALELFIKLHMAHRKVT